MSGDLPRKKTKTSAAAAAARDRPTLRHPLDHIRHVLVQKCPEGHLRCEYTFYVHFQCRMGGREPGSPANLKQM
jgi:hypothetical protein